MRKSLILIAMLVSLGAGAQTGDHRSYDCYRTTGKIRIDGKLTEPDWQAAPRSEAFVDIRGVDFQPAPMKQTYMKMLWDDECLYVAGIIEEDQVTASLTERDAIIYKDNDFEIFLDPDGDGKFYFEFECNAFGTLMDLIMDKPYNDGGNFFMPWDCKNVRLKVHVDGKINNAKRVDGRPAGPLRLPLLPGPRDEESGAGRGPVRHPGRRLLGVGRLPDGPEPALEEAWRPGRPVLRPHGGNRPVLAAAARRILIEAAVQLAGRLH